MLFLAECDELEGDEVASGVLAVELIEFALCIDAHYLLEDEPVAQRVQVLAFLELLDREIVIVARQEPTDLAGLDILNWVVVATHDGASFSRGLPVNLLAYVS